MNKKRKIPYVPPEERFTEERECGNIMGRFKKFLQKPLTTTQVIMMYISWILMILYYIVQL